MTGSGQFGRSRLREIFRHKQTSIYLKPVVCRQMCFLFVATYCQDTCLVRMFVTFIKHGGMYTDHGLNMSASYGGWHWGFWDEFQVGSISPCHDLLQNHVHYALQLDSPREPLLRDGSKGGVAIILIWKKNLIRFWGWITISNVQNRQDL